MFIESTRIRGMVIFTKLTRLTILPICGRCNNTIRKLWGEGCPSPWCHYKGESEDLVAKPMGEISYPDSIFYIAHDPLPILVLVWRS